MKRYACELGQDCWGGTIADMAEDATGEWIRFEDQEQQIALLWLCVRAADRLNADTMYKSAPEAKELYRRAREQLELSEHPKGEPK